MPSPAGYPLSPLLAHRERLVEEAESTLARAVQGREAADRAAAAARAEKQAAEERAQAIRAEEAARVARGEARAVDLARGMAWEQAEAKRMSELEGRVDETARAVLRAREAEAGARAELAARSADRDVVAKDEAKFLEGKARAAEARAEEDAAEAWGGARGRAGGAS